MCACVCEYLGEEEDGEVVLFSVDSSDPPISSDPLLEERFPKKMNDFGNFPFFPPPHKLHRIFFNSLYLILIKVCNDNTNKQSESNHTSQEHKDVDVDAMDLQTHKPCSIYISHFTA